jgi:outer membrane lipopolysaccharide assembly protein LptE/RlpB
MKIRQLFIFVLLFSLAGCGFHLRNHQSRISTRYPTIILPQTGSHTFHQALRRALQTASIRVVEDPTKITAPQLMVSAENITAQPLVYGPDSELRRERLKMNVSFTFGADTLKSFDFFTERDRQLNSKQHLGDNAEKILIEQEMQADIINQLLRFLANSQL